MTIPHYINEDQSDIRAIKPGWYGLESNGKLSSGPFPNQEKCLTGITQPRSNCRASPWRHANHNPEVVANNARDKKAAMDYLALRGAAGGGRAATPTYKSRAACFVLFPGWGAGTGERGPRRHR
jgi:hypothetical protein